MMIGAIDILLLITVIFSVLFALYRGLVRELLGISAWILAGLAALYSYAPLQPLMNKLIENPMIAGITGSVIVAVIVLVIMTLINSAITKRLRQSALSGLDRVLGFIFGVARAGLLAAVVYLGASMALSTEQLDKIETQNVSVPYVRVISGWLEYMIPENIQEKIESYKQGKLQRQKVPKIGIDLKKNVKEAIVEYSEENKELLDDMINRIEWEDE